MWKNQRIHITLKQLEVNLSILVNWYTLSTLHTLIQPKSKRQLILLIILKVVDGRKNNGTNLLTDTLNVILDKSKIEI